MATYDDVKELLMLEAALKGFEVTGDMNPSLEPYWKEYQASNPRAKMGPEFAAEMRKILDEMSANQQGYSPVPMTAGPKIPKWPFAGRKPEGNNAADIFTRSIQRISGE